MENKPQSFPRQHQDKQPGAEEEMHPRPEIIREDYAGSGKLLDCAALITGGDSGIGRSAAVHFAREGADVAVAYLDEDDDAFETRDMVQAEGRECLLIRGDVRSEDFCRGAVRKTVERFGRLDVLVNNAAVQYPQDNLESISSEQLKETFFVNIFPHFYFTQEALKHMKAGAAIINTTSVNAFSGNPLLIDYSSTKGAILAFTRALATQLAQKGIRVNAVAPGPVWTPLIPSSFEPEGVEQFGGSSLLGRAGQPSEVGPAYVFLASKDSSYIVGETIHVNGGQFIGS